VALQVSAAYFDYFAAQVSLRNATLNAATNDTLYRLNQGRFEVGKIGENDLLQSELEQLRARTALDGARLEHDRALAALRLALNLPVEPLEIT
jgi:outer membrane protein TolC